MQCLMPLLTLLQLHNNGHCTYPSFPGISFNIIVHSILSKPLAAFPNHHLWYNGLVSRERKMNPVKMTVVTPCHAGYQTSKLLFCQVLDASHTGSLTLYSIDTQETALENIVGKGEFARNEQISPFPTMFSTQSDNCISICPYFLRHIFFYCWIWRA